MLNLLKEQDSVQILPHDLKEIIIFNFIALRKYVVFLIAVWRCFRIYFRG
jgi:uncharacterized membrane protein (GlpM family)